jgi:hypothetical protein
MNPTSPEGNAAYRRGLCIDCRTRRYSAGRPRCNDCHTARNLSINSDTPQREAA